MATKTKTKIHYQIYKNFQWQTLPFADIRAGMLVRRILGSRVEMRQGGNGYQIYRAEKNDQKKIVLTAVHGDGGGNE